MAEAAVASPPAGAPAAAPSTERPAATPNMTDPLPVPSNPPRPGSARAKMQQETGKKWGEEPTAQPEKTATAPKTAEVPKTTETPKTTDEPPEKIAAEAPADITPEQKKKNPWVLYRESEKKVKALESQIVEAKSSSLAETERAQFQEKIEKSEAKLKEYEDEIRFKSFEKSPDFKRDYEVPYEKAWEKHVRDLRGVTVLDDAGASRPMEAKDILDLVNLELPDARKLATEKWGDFAQDAMSARKEIRDLFEKKTQALDEARKNGADREKTFQENAKKWRDNVQKQIKETWDTSNKAALEHPVNGEFFKPVEGDDTRNQLLGKGFALVDEAFGKNPNDPNLTPEERASIVKKHAAVRNRAAAFGPMKYLIAQLRKKLADLEKTAGEMRSSTPPAGGGTAGPGGGAPGGGTARDRMRQAGDKYAK